MKIDCSNTVNFFKEVKRICDKYVPYCAVCPLDATDKGLTCHSFFRHCSREAIEIVQKWSDEHPQKTRLEYLKESIPEKYPNANIDVLLECLCVVGLGYPRPEGCPAEFGLPCEECWNMPV